MTLKYMALWPLLLSRSYIAGERNFHEFNAPSSVPWRLPSPKPISDPNTTKSSSSTDPSNVSFNSSWS